MQRGHRALLCEDILIHTIVHDLAAPLHSIMGVLSLLDERPHREPEAGWIRLGIQAARRQRELITEILDVFAAEGGARSQRGTEGVELSDVIDRVVAEREPVARKRNLRIEARLLPAPCRVVGEETRLFRVLTNLLDNAFRYSPAGGVVRISTRREDATVAVRPGRSSPAPHHRFGVGAVDEIARSEAPEGCPMTFSLEVPLPSARSLAAGKYPY